MRAWMIAVAAGLAALAGQAAAGDAVQRLAPALQSGDRVGSSDGGSEDLLGLSLLPSLLLAATAVVAATVAVNELAQEDDPISP